MCFNLHLMKELLSFPMDTNQSSKLCLNLILGIYLARSSNIKSNDFRIGILQHISRNYIRTGVKRQFCGRNLVT